MARDSQASSPAKARPPGKRAETTLKDLQARHASMAQEGQKVFEHVGALAWLSG